jgi:hypothetical protein
MKEEKSEVKAKRSPEALRMTDDPSVCNKKRINSYFLQDDLSISQFLQVSLYL